MYRDNHEQRDPQELQLRSDEGANVEEFFTRDLITLDSVETDFFLRAALAAGFGRVVEHAVDGEPAGAGLGIAAEKRPVQLLTMEDVVVLEYFRLTDDRLLADGFLAVAFDRDHVRRIHRAHHL